MNEKAPRRALVAAGLAVLGACAGPVAGPQSKSAAPTAGWTIAPDGDLNGFFDCLAASEAALVSAHRGGPADGFPENAVETFANTLATAPAMIEVDVATSADGVLYLMHDDDLARTTTSEGATDALDWEDIRSLKLLGPDGEPTAFSPPSFADALSFAKGRTILQIDFKRTTRYEDAIDEINRQGAGTRVILIAYTLAQAERLHRLAPDMMISLTVSTQSDLNRAVAAGVPLDRLLGFTGVDDPRPRLFSLLGNQGVEVIFGTLGGRSSIDAEIEASGDDRLYAEFAGMGADVIATDRPFAAQAALDAEGRGAEAGECGIDKR